MNSKFSIAKRFRGFLPVIVDVETGGFNPLTDALLEIAIVIVDLNDEGRLMPVATHACHVMPFPGANMDPLSLAVNHIDPYHPFRFAVTEEEALKQIFQPIRHALKQTGCQRAVLTGHNANFDLSFILAAAKRAQIKRNPFHPFTTFDTATLSALVFGETVLARATQAAGIPFKKEEAHSAIYDAETTAVLFCDIVNRWPFQFADKETPK